MAIKGWHVKESMGHAEVSVGKFGAKIQLFVEFVKQTENSPFQVTQKVRTKNGFHHDRRQTLTLGKKNCKPMQHNLTGVKLAGMAVN